jgi:hypothetical protein
LDRGSGVAGYRSPGIVEQIIDESGKSECGGDSLYRSRNLIHKSVLLNHGGKPKIRGSRRDAFSNA